MNPEDYLEIDNSHLVEEIIQIVSSPKWSCPSISKETLTNVKVIESLDRQRKGFSFLRNVFLSMFPLKRQLFRARVVS